MTRQKYTRSPIPTSKSHWRTLIWTRHFSVSWWTERRLSLTRQTQQLSTKKVSWDTYSRNDPYQLKRSISRKWVAILLMRSIVSQVKFLARKNICKVSKSKLMVESEKVPLNNSNFRMKEWKSRKTNKMTLILSPCFFPNPCPFKTTNYPLIRTFPAIWLKTKNTESWILNELKVTSIPNPHRGSILTTSKHKTTLLPQSKSLIKICWEEYSWNNKAIRGKAPLCSNRNPNDLKVTTLHSPTTTKASIVIQWMLSTSLPITIIWLPMWIPT